MRNFDLVFFAMSYELWVMSIFLFKTRSFLFISSPQCVRDWSGILCERISVTGFGSGNEVTELVEVPRSDSVARRRPSEQRYSGKPDA